MSFSKAKIQRFNDIKECTPSPAKYNVSIQEKIKLGLITKPGTYSKKTGSPHGSESGSVHSTPCFQTPTLPLKKKKLLSFKSVKSSHQEELRDKIVECNNKDLYIRDLIEQIEEMTGRINHLQNENSQLIEEKNEHQGALLQLQKQYKENNLRHAKEFQGVGNEVKEVNKELREIRQKYEDLKCQNLVDLSKLLSQIQKVEELYEKTLKESREEFTRQLQELEETHLKEVETLQAIHKEEIFVVLKKLEESELQNSENTKQVEILRARHVEEMKKLEESTFQISEKTKEVEMLRLQHEEEMDTILKKLDESILEISEKTKEVEMLRLQHQEEIDTVMKKLAESTLEVSEKTKEVEMLRLQHQEEKDTILKELEERTLEISKKTEEVELLRLQHQEEIETISKKLEESRAKTSLLQDNFKDVRLLSELQISEKIKQIEESWKEKFEAKEKEHEAILKECQEISEYSIIQSEVEKNQVKKLLEEKEVSYENLLKKCQEEIANLKSEKHAYEVSITTFKDTIEVLKKRLINSDRDVVQLKEELEKCEEKILIYEKKCTDLTTQIHEIQIAKEELEMQYESTSKLMQNEVKSVEKKLLVKMELLQNEIKQLSKDRELLDEVLVQYHDQQEIINQAQETILKTNFIIDDLESRQVDLEETVENYKLQLAQETEEAAEIRKKYIEKSGKYDELAQQFEQVLQDLDKAKERIQELEEQLRLVNLEKNTIEQEVKELGVKYAELVGHHNHNQKIKHVIDLKEKNLELSKKSIDLEAKNFKLNKLVEKLMKENEDLSKSGKKCKKVEDKENLGSPKCLKLTHSPGPLKEKN